MADGDGPGVLYDDPSLLYDDPDTLYAPASTDVPPIIVTPPTEPGSGRVQLIAYDLPAQRITGEVAFADLSWAEEISGEGSLDVSVLAGTAGAALCVPGRTLLYVEQGPALLWGGIVWARAWSAGSPPRLKVGGASWWSYYKRRTIRSTLDYPNTEQFAIVASILSYAHAVNAKANPLRTTIRRHPSSTSTTRARTYQATERKGVAEAIEEIGSARNGFEFLPTVAWDTATTPPSPAHFLDLWSPRLGRLTPIVWTHGSDVAVESHDLDGASLATLVDAVGSGDGAAKVISTAQLTNAFPLLERQVSYTDSTSAGWLTDQAEAELARTAEPPATAQVRLRDLERWPLGSWITGDEVFLSAHDVGLTIEGYYRVQGYKAQVGATGQLEVTVDLALGAALGRPITSPARRLPRETVELRRRLKVLEGK